MVKLSRSWSMAKLMMLLHDVNKTQKAKNPDFGKLITQINEPLYLKINSMNGRKNHHQ